jgi:transcriptional regulator with XRE-family HTH domain
MAIEATGLESSMDHPTMGALLRQLQKKAGRSQPEQAAVLCQLSGRCTVTRINVSRWELEKRIPRMPWLQWIAESFDVPIAQIRAAATISKNRRHAENLRNAALS